MQKLLLIDDEGLLLAVLARSLSRTYQVQIVSNAHALRAALRDTGSWLAVLEPELGYAGEGYALLQELVGLSIPVLVLSRSANSQAMLASYYMGAQGFLGKQAGEEELWQALDWIKRGELAFPSHLLQHLLADATQALPALTAREYAVLQMLCEHPAPANAEIAQRLNRSVDSVKVVVRTLLALFGAAGRDELVREALRRGFMPSLRLPRLPLVKLRKRSA